MNYEITLDEETEAIITRRAKRRGITVAEYLSQMANSVVQRPRKQSQQIRSTTEIQELLAQFGRNTGDVYIADDVNVRELAYEGLGE